MSITKPTSLSHAEFLERHGQSQWVCRFSTDAKIAILNYIKYAQSEGEDPDWQDVFVQAAEYTNERLVLDGEVFETEDTADRLIEIAQDFDFNTAIKEQLDNKGGLDDETLWNNVKHGLAAHPEFLTRAAGVVGYYYELKLLDNGNWLQM